MFTGIIQSIGVIKKIDLNNNKFIIKTFLNLDDCQIGSSICCDGVCLTATKIIRIDNEYNFYVNIGEETIQRSNLSSWYVDKKINLERSLKVGNEISGHFVYGHVDATVSLKKIVILKNSKEFQFNFGNSENSVDFRKFIVEKGSLAINGISLTVANVSKEFFKISVIPHTFDNTNLKYLKENDIVNIEFDPLARYTKN